MVYIIKDKYQQNEMREIKVLGYNDKDYPQKLRNITNSPDKLYVLGDLPKAGTLSVAIVGARNASPYGRSVAQQFARVLSNHGIQIISGMARGIDAAAHIGALEGMTKTFAVLGNGVDICYPKENINIYHKIKSSGGIISEIDPGTSPIPKFFPMRNRIISALADIVLIVEAKEKSGALITADLALEQGKDVFAIPGRITDELSKGCNHLIMQGAGIACCPEDILKELSICPISGKQENRKKQILLATEEISVYSCMSLQPKHINELACESGISIEKISKVLLDLQLKGVITEITKNYYISNEAASP